MSVKERIAKRKQRLARREAKAQRPKDTPLQAQFIQPPVQPKPAEPVAKPEPKPKPSPQMESMHVEVTGRDNRGDIKTLTVTPSYGVLH